MRKKSKVEKFIDKYIYDTSAPQSISYEQIKKGFRFLSGILFTPLILTVSSFIRFEIPEIVYYIFALSGTIILLIPIKWRHYVVKLLIKIEIKTKHPWKRVLQRIRLIIQRQLNT